MELSLSPLTEAHHRRVCELLSMNIQWPQMSLVVTAGEQFVSSVYLYPTQLWLFAEFFVADHQAFPFQRTIIHTAGELIAEQFVTQAAIMNLTPACAPRTRSIIKGLERWGFQDTGTSLLLGGRVPVPAYVKRPSEEGPKQPGDRGDQPPEGTVSLEPNVSKVKRRKRKSKKPLDKDQA